MQKLKNLNVTLVLLVSSLLVSSCNSGSTTSSTPSSSNTTYMSPSGITYLPNGAQVTTTSTALLSIPGKSNFTRLTRILHKL